MNRALERIAARFGISQHYEKHGHHILRMGKVVLVGSVCLIVQGSIFELLGIRDHLISPSTAILLGAEAAILVNFFLNERFTFRHTHHHPLWQRLLRFHLLLSFSITLQWASVFVVQHFTKEAVLLRLAFLCSVGIGFIFNYLGYYYLVWKKHRSAL